MSHYRGPVFSRRMLLSAAVVGVGGALLAACGGTGTTPAAQSGGAVSASSSGASTAPQSGGGAPTKLVFWRHQYDPTDKVLKEIIFPDARAKLNLEFDFQVQRDADYCIVPHMRYT